MAGSGEGPTLSADAVARAAMHLEAEGPDRDTLRALAGDDPLVEITDLHAGYGRMEILLPYATLEPVRELLLQMFMGEKFGRDSIWEGHLANELWDTEIEVEAVLDKQMMMLSRVMSWEVGTQLPLGATPHSKVALDCGDIHLFDGKMGRRNQKIAVSIDRKFIKNGRFVREGR